MLYRDFALVNIENKHQPYAVNKDLNGGLGTVDRLEGGILLSIVSKYRKRNFKLPVLTLVHLQSILISRDFTTEYFESALPDEAEYQFKAIVIYASMVDYPFELECAKKLKRTFEKARIGFVGPFVAQRPHIFEEYDFWVTGEAEYYFLHQFKSFSDLKGRLAALKPIDMNELPAPDLSGFNSSHYAYSNILKRPFFTWQASRGCPYSCSYYCTYGAYQGKKMRVRAPAKVVSDLKLLQEKYMINSVLFRDPVFGLQKNFVELFCRELIKQGVQIEWAIETRLDLLDKQKLFLMKENGLRCINVGIETFNDKVAKRNHRNTASHQRQVELVSYCRELGVEVNALYVIGLISDTRKTIQETIEYSILLDTDRARFSVCTPYPGTALYDELQRHGSIFESDLTRYNQFSPVFKHDNLSSDEILKLLNLSYRRFYIRFKILKRLFKRLITL